jgi:hypothetical protein
MIDSFLTGGRARPRGDLAVKITGPDGKTRGPGLRWRLSNFRHWWRGYWRKELARLARIPTMIGEVAVTVTKADGQVVDYGVVSYRVVTTAYVTNLATNQFDGSGAALTAFDYHDAGTGTNAEAVGDTTLQTAFGGSRVAGTPTNPSAGAYRSTATIPFTSTLAITEHGLFSASTSGTLADRSVFTAINVVSGDSIQFQYTLTYSAGG